MRPFRIAALSCAFVVLSAEAASLHAAWNNVFQVACWHCRDRAPAPVVAGYGPVVANYGACCDPCPQQVCTTRMVQRCYYQNVTVMQPRSWVEEITSYRTSFYREAVTTMRLSFYRDPCTGCCQQVAVPCTSYRWRAQCCPVKSYVQRCCLVPVTTQQQVFYFEPVTTCCQVSCCAPCDPCAGTPGVRDQHVAPNGTNGAPGVRQYYDSMPPATNNSRQLPIGTPRSSAPINPPSAPPSVKLERIVALPPREVEGSIVRDDKSPEGNVRVKLISQENQGAEQTVTADAQGRFNAKLTSGSWLVYVQRNDGKLDFVRKIEVRDQDSKQYSLVSR
jgi:hypothetical protein